MINRGKLHGELLDGGRLQIIIQDYEREPFLLIEDVEDLIALLTELTRESWRNEDRS